MGSIAITTPKFSRVADAPIEVMRRPPTFIRFLASEGLLSFADAKTLTESSSKAGALLGQMMLRRKLLTLRQMVELLETQASQPGKRIGELAVDAGHLDKQTLDALLAEQAESAPQHPLDTLQRGEKLSREVLFEAMVAYIKLLEEPTNTAQV